MLIQIYVNFLYLWVCIANACIHAFICVCVYVCHLWPNATQVYVTFLTISQAALQIKQKLVLNVRPTTRFSWIQVGPKGFLLCVNNVCECGVWVSIYVFMYAHLDVCLFVCLYICMYIFVHIYVFITVIANANGAYFQFRSNFTYEPTVLYRSTMRFSNMLWFVLIGNLYLSLSLPFSPALSLSLCFSCFYFNPLSKTFCHFRNLYRYNNYFKISHIYSYTYTHVNCLTRLIWG